MKSIKLFLTAFGLVILCNQAFASSNCTNSMVYFYNTDSTNVVQYTQQSCYCGGVNIPIGDKIAVNSNISGTAQPATCGNSSEFYCTYVGQLVNPETRVVAREFNFTIKGESGSSGGDCNFSGTILASAGSEKTIPSNWYNNANGSAGYIKIYLCNNTDMTQCESQE